MCKKCFDNRVIRTFVENIDTTSCQCLGNLFISTLFKYIIMTTMSRKSVYQYLSQLHRYYSYFLAIDLIIHQLKTQTRPFYLGTRFISTLARSINIDLISRQYIYYYTSQEHKHDAYVSAMNVLVTQEHDSYVSAFVLLIQLPIKARNCRFSICLWIMPMKVWSEKRKNV